MAGSTMSQIHVCVRTTKVVRGYGQHPWITSLSVVLAAGSHCCTSAGIGDTLSIITCKYANSIGMVRDDAAPFSIDGAYVEGLMSRKRGEGDKHDPRIQGNVSTIVPVSETRRSPFALLIGGSATVPDVSLSMLKCTRTSAVMLVFCRNRFSN